MAGAGSVIVNAKLETKDFKAKLADMKKGLTGLDSGFKKSNISAKNIGATLSSTVTPALIAVGTLAIGAYAKIEEGQKALVKATGATGESAKALGETYRNVASQVKGDFGDIGALVGELNTRLGFEGEALEKASVAFAHYAEVTGVDATQAVKDVTRAMQSWGVEADQYQTVLDKLTVAGQKSGISVDQLTKSLNDNSAVFKEMGFTMDESIAYMAEFELAGVDTSSVLRGMKSAFKEWASAGLDANTEFANVVNGIRDGSVTASDAIELFGAKAGPELYDAISTGRLGGDQFIDMLNGVAEASGATEATFEEQQNGLDKLAIAWQSAQVAMGEFGGEIAGTLAPIVEGIVGVIGTLTEAWRNIPEPVQQAIVVIGLVLAVAGPLIMIIASIVSAVTTLLPILGMISPVGLVVVAVIGAIVGAIILAISNFETIQGVVSSVFGSIVGLIQGPMDTAKSLVEGAINTISGIFSGAHFQFPSIKLPHFTITGEFGIDPPRVPSFGISWYATGGVFNGPSVIGIGEAGTEYALRPKHLEEIAELMNARSGGNGGTVYNISFDNVRVNDDKEIEQVTREFITTITRLAGR